MRSKFIHLLIIISLLPVLFSCRKEQAVNDVNQRFANLSIDDVEVFSDLINYQNDYDSLFQHPFFNFLKNLHKDYGLVVTLYTYELLDNDNVTLKEMPLKYKNDFRKASDWLRIGFHSKRHEFDSLISVADFHDSYNNVNSAISQFADSSMIAKTLRFHYFFAPDSLLNGVPGIGSLLCADNKNRMSYNLTPPEALTVANKGGIVKNNITYRRTDLRIDDNYRILFDLKLLDSSDTLVVFAHQWKLYHIRKGDSRQSAAGKIKVWAKESFNRLLFKETVKRLYNSGYKFSFLE